MADQEEHAELRGKPLGTQALDTMVMLSSYLPTIFGTGFLATAHDNFGGEFKDEKGVMGGLAGVLTLGYGVFFCMGTSMKSPDLCKVIMMSRLSLGVLFVIGGAFLAVQSDLLRAVIFFCYSAFALPEAYLLFTYGASLQRDIDQANFEAGGGRAQLEMQSQMGYGNQNSERGPPQSAPPFHSQPGYHDQQGGMQVPMSDGGFGLAPVQGGGGFGAPPPQGQWNYH